ncbi:CDP-alcohol phosphatidyltransferase family protein [Actinoplanes sp. GCM10030250]|uniref:CDP-alcohol phosphatidyltransferase family protein n=1 Tax=Actinoplanes sp. GCM10030250 TaxID=3273376 RepID=UPI00360C716D
MPPTGPPVQRSQPSAESRHWDPGLLESGSDGARFNLPNAITALRTIVSVSFAVAAITQADMRFAVIAYLVYWIGDVLDGLAARLLDQETRFGAVFDIISDRACFALCGAALMTLRPDAAIPITVFLLHFLVLDCQLSLVFLRWPIVSPNYFYVVHPGIYRWNWWPPAKVLNTTALAVAVLLPVPIWVGVVIGLAAMVVKGVSLVAVSRIPGYLRPPAPPALT